MPKITNFNNFEFSHEPPKRIEPSEGEKRASRITQLTLQRLIETQTIFKQIVEQINKLKVIHEDIMSIEIYNDIISKCESHLPKGEN